ncbi:hypothetical protein [Vibrio harveyi]|uniref:hypothetical protein n=1 Tax=Vibrio harveyi TaxID=669 RepID=UPI0023802CBA|nr:hypothetical protein [Vibrio harveyi]
MYTKMVKELSAELKELCPDLDINLRKFKRDYHNHLLFRDDVIENGLDAYLNESLFRNKVLASPNSLNEEMKTLCNYYGYSDSDMLESITEAKTRVIQREGRKFDKHMRFEHLEKLVDLSVGSFYHVEASPIFDLNSNIRTEEETLDLRTSIRSEFAALSRFNLKDDNMGAKNSLFVGILDCFDINQANEDSLMNFGEQAVSIKDGIDEDLLIIESSSVVDNLFYNLSHTIDTNPAFNKSFNAVKTLTNRPVKFPSATPSEYHPDLTHKRNNKFRR